MSPTPNSQGLKIKGKSKQSIQSTEVKASKRQKRRSKKKDVRSLAPSIEDGQGTERILNGLEGGDSAVTGSEEKDDFEHLGLGNDLTFEGAENLASPEAGPSRLPMTPSGTSFTPLPRSVLSGFARRPSSSPDRSKSPRQIPDVIVDTEPATDKGSDPAPVNVSEHFEPPALFSVPADKIIEAQPQLHALPATPSSDKLVKTGETSTRGLLLPDNILVDELEESGEAVQSEEAGNMSMEGLHFVDDNITRGAQRYFVAEQTEEDAFLASADQSKICQNCKQPGHRQKDCPHTICTVCGAMDQHERRECPHGITCFGCGQRGHRQSDCPDPASRHSRRRGCDRCGSREHPEGACPSIWRVYKYYSKTERSEMQDKKRKAKDWAREALGDVGAEMFCYNCARSGHLGDDCPQRRASHAKLFNPTAFSNATARRGPYYGVKDTPSNIPASTHTRFDDDDTLPDVAPAFGGSNVGRKSREKARKAMIDREANATEDDEEDWFSNKRSPASTPIGTNRGGLNIRGRGGKPNGMPRGRPWDSDSRPTQGRSDPARGMPFGHSHLMASAPAKGKSISFQNIDRNDSTVNSPTASKGKGKKAASNPARSMLERAIKGSQREQASPRPNQPSRSTPEIRNAPSSPVGSDASSRKKRKKKNKDDDDDLESTWWSSGRAGGNVSEWGKDMPSPAGSKKGMMPKGNKGQQYTGGY